MAIKLVFIPGLVSDRRAWLKVDENIASQGFETFIADVSTAESLTAMAQSILDETEGMLIAVGHSMGGRVAMELARLAPDRLAGMVLVATGAHPLAEGELANREKVVAIAHTEGMQALCDHWLPPMLAPDTPSLYPALYFHLQQMIIEAGPQVHERQIRALIARPDARWVLENFTAPILFVAGEHDGWSTPEQHQEMASLVKSGRSEVVVVRGAGHFLQVERPEKFSQLLLQWLQKIELSGPR